MTIATSTRFARPTSSYAGNTSLANDTKYQDDASASPKVAISSTKMDGDLNFLINAVNLLDDDLSSIVAGAVSDNSVTNAKLRDSGALSVIGRSANSTGDPADISVSAFSGYVLRESGSTLGFGEVDGSVITDDTITAAKLTTDSVTEPKIVDGAVTLAKLATGVLPIKQIVTNSVQGAGESTSSTSYADITGHTITITPTSASSSILIIAFVSNQLSMASGFNSVYSMKIVRGASTAVNEVVVNYTTVTGVTDGDVSTVHGVDSPATTSATTYKLQHKVSDVNSTGTASYAGSAYHNTIIAIEF